jgi:hypothetical protein
MKERNIHLILLCTLLDALTASAFGQTVAADWQKRLEQRLAEFQSCSEAADDSSPCNRFVAQAFAGVYGIHDFEDPSKQGQYLSANVIEAYVTVTKAWVFLGYADTQQALDEATAAANEKRAVIAIKPGEEHGHVAIVLPGPQTDSASWKLKVPNSACFFLGKPHQSYVADKLSKAFASPAGVKLFGRVY